MGGSFGSLLFFCPDASVIPLSSTASDTRMMSGVQSQAVQSKSAVTLRTQEKKGVFGQIALSQCFCHEVDLIICVALFCVKWLSFTSFNKKSVCERQTQKCYSSYRAAISASAFFICSFTLSGAVIRTALPRLNIQPKNCWLTATETTTRK